MIARRVTAAVAAFVAGAAVLAGFFSAGLLLDQRLAGDSMPLFVGVIVFFGVAGGYAGWLVALIVFSAVRGGVEEGADSGR